MTKRIPVLFVVACLIAGGCSSPNVNPPAPRSNTGYVDFYTDSDLGLSWQIKRGRDGSSKLRTVFSEFNPVEGSIVRLAASPGTHVFEVWFNNLVTEGPQTVTVEVAAQQITPVHVTLTPTRGTLVDQKTTEYRPQVRAARQVTRITSQENTVFQINATAESAQSYQPKERMPYWDSSSVPR